MFKKKAFLLAFFFIVFIQLSSAAAGYNLSPDDIAVIQRGYRLYLGGDVAGDYADGKYTDPNLDTKVLDFWTNGRFARYDRNGDGHHETILAIRRQRLFYIGTIDVHGIFIDVGQD
ncbi:hypothetical protein HUU61_25350, partial [Rhodopseudomonas palustris]|nr:hypothetical protein [Rhodopseudomonas palustris]